MAGTVMRDRRTGCRGRHAHSHIRPAETRHDIQHNRANDATVHACAMMHANATVERTMPLHTHGTPLLHHPCLRRSAWTGAGVAYRADLTSMTYAGPT